MSEKILVPVLGESITEATVAKWLKSKGETVEIDEPIVELETDKVNLEVPSPVDGVLSEINAIKLQLSSLGGWNVSLIIIYRLFKESYTLYCYIILFTSII